MAGHDVIGQAQTGTGKTAAFGLPLLPYLDPEAQEMQAIVLTPTRELCIQVTQALRSYAEHLDIEILAVFGGEAIPTQTVPAALRRPRRRRHGGPNAGPDTRARCSSPQRASSCSTRPTRCSTSALSRTSRDPAHVPGGRQTALFSATMPPPVERLAEGYMYNPVTIRVTPKTLTVDTIAAGLRRGPGEGEDRSPRRDPAGRRPRAGDHLLPDQDRHVAARAGAGQGLSRRSMAISARASATA